MSDQQNEIRHDKVEAVSHMFSILGQMIEELTPAEDLALRDKSVEYEAFIERISVIVSNAYAQASAQLVEQARTDARVMAGFLASDRAPGEHQWQSPWITACSEIDLLIQKHGGYE